MLTTEATRVRIGALLLMILGSSGDTVPGYVTRVEPSAFTKVSSLGVEEQRVQVIASLPASGTRGGRRWVRSAGMERGGVWMQ